MSNADLIRKYAADHFVRPARNRGEKTFTIVTGDVHRQMGLRDRNPSVCTALASEKFFEMCSVDLIGRQGPPSGKSSTVKYVYSFRDRESGASQEHENRKRSSVGQDSASSQKSSDAEAFEALRGLFKGMFREVGGGEAYLRQEREALDKNVSAYRPEDGRER